MSPRSETINLDVIWLWIFVSDSSIFVIAFKQFTIELDFGGNHANQALGPN